MKAIKKTSIINFIECKGNDYELVKNWETEDNVVELIGSRDCMLKIHKKKETIIATNKDVVVKGCENELFVCNIERFKEKYFYAQYEPSSSSYTISNF